MYILDTKKIKEQIAIYIIAILACILFAMIYEYFSHGVISYFMVGAFAIPLILGVVVFSIYNSLKNKKKLTIRENQLYNAGIATLTIGSIMQGVLQIYGTTNWKVYIYLVVGIAFIVFSMASYFFNLNIDKIKNYCYNKRRKMHNK